jgi:hypothetical protein
LLDAADRRAEVHLDSFRLEHAKDQPACLRLVVREQSVEHLDEGDAAPEAAERLRELEARRAASEHEQARRRRLYAIVVGGGLVLAAVVAVVVVVAAGGGGGGDGSSKGTSKLDIKAQEPPPQKTDSLDQAAKAAGCKLINPPIEGSTHLKPGSPTPKYKTDPPASGNHDPVPSDDGAYGKAPSIKHLLHSLEHGRIEYQFKPSLEQRRIAQLKGLFEADPYHVILTPNPTRMPYEVAAVAWGHLAGCKKVSDRSFDVLRTFTTRFRDKGPEFVP